MPPAQRRPPAAKIPRLMTENRSMKFVEILARRAAERPDVLALADAEESLTYAQLLARIEAETARYEPMRQRAVVFRCEQRVESVVKYFAIHAAGAVAVPLAADAPALHEQNIAQMLEGRTFPATAADILFTTGTTGQAKGVIIPHEAIVADAENLAEAQRFSPRLTFIICGPLNHIGSLSKLYPSLLVGASVRILEGMKDVGAFFAAAQTAPGKIASFMVPATLRMLTTFAAEKLAAIAPRVDFIETGAAAISPAEMQRLIDLLPHSRLYNTYASTETGIACTHDFANDGAEAGLLGRPMRHTRLRITPDGHIAVGGGTIMQGYVADEALTSSVLRDGEVVTADLGHIDAHGRLRLTGRDGDTINVGGYKVAPTEVEAEAMRVPGVADCLCIPARHAVLGTVLKLLVVAEQAASEGHAEAPAATPPRPTFRAIAAALRQRLEPYKVPQLYAYVPAIARTFNGKPDRKAYRNAEAL